MGPNAEPQGEGFGGGSRPPRASAGSIAALTLCALLAAGCGFQLRTWDISAAFATFAIDAPREVTLARSLARTLEAAGLRRVEADADIVIRLADQREDRRSASVTGAGRAAEVELTLEVTFGVKDRAGAELIPDRAVRLERVFRLDTDNVVGSSEEESLLLGEMRTEVTTRILRSLDAVARLGAASTASPPAPAPSS